MSEPIIAVLSVLAAVLVGLEQVTLPSPWGEIIRVAAVAVAAVVARSQSMPNGKAIALVTAALDAVPPADSKKAAAEMVAAAKESK